MRRKTINNIFFIVVTVVLIITIATMFKMTVHGMNMDNNDRAIEEYNRALEKEYIENVKECLEGAGIRNAGIMLTKVIDAEGNRFYTLTINHKRISEKDIVSRIEELGSPVPQSSISIMTTT